MGLGNPLEVVLYHLLIRGMASLGYRHGFPMVSVLVCMVDSTHGSLALKAYQQNLYLEYYY